MPLAILKFILEIISSSPSGTTENNRKSKIFYIKSSFIKTFNYKFSTLYFIWISNHLFVKTLTSRSNTCFQPPRSHLRRFEVTVYVPLKATLKADSLKHYCRAARLRREERLGNSIKLYRMYFHNFSSLILKK